VGPWDRGNLSQQSPATGRARTAPREPGLAWRLRHAAVRAATASPSAPARGNGWQPGPKPFLNWPDRRDAFLRPPDCDTVEAFPGRHATSGAKRHHPLSWAGICLAHTTASADTDPDLGMSGPLDMQRSQRCCRLRHEHAPPARQLRWAEHDCPSRISLAGYRNFLKAGQAAVPCRAAV
jgi:hypothetical protein